MNTPKSPVPHRFLSTTKDLDELEKLAGISPKGGKRDISQEIAQKFVAKSSPNEEPEADDDPFWSIHKHFVSLLDRFGKPFSRFLGDILDILLSGPFQERLVHELITEKIKKRRKAEKPEALMPEGLKNPPNEKVEPEIQIGGEPKMLSRHYLKRKGLLASLFLESEEYPSYMRIIKSISEICTTDLPPGFPGPVSPAGRREALEQIVSRLQIEITRDELLKAWHLLSLDRFEHLEWVFNTTKDIGLVRPSFYEDLDKAYRDAKKLLKLLCLEFEKEFPPKPEKRDTILAYLRDIIEVYTHHHFVLKYFHQIRAGITRHELQEKDRDALNRIEGYKSGLQRLRNESLALAQERDRAVSLARSLQKENEQLTVKLHKLDPSEVERQIRAMEAKVNLISREHQATLEEDTVLRTALRQLDAENQELTQALQKLHAIPDEQAKSVDGLLIGKRVVIFGGIGRDHYWSILREAGVKDPDYEWYEGYRTISQQRTAEIVGRHDVIVVITSYAGHLYLWQTRECITPRQTHILVHSSGAGSLRQQILENFRKKNG